MSVSALAILAATGSAAGHHTLHTHQDPRGDDPRPLPVGRKARVAVETRQLRRAREREERKAGR